MDLLRSWRAVRHLRPGQVTNRVTRRLRRPPHAWGEAERYALQPRRASKPAGVIVRHVVDGGLRFLNETRPFEGEDRWRPRGVASLWAEQLHGFRWLWELEPAEAAARVALWLEENPPLSPPGWAPAPTSVRVREWLEWLLAHPDAPEALRARMVASVAHQVRTLEATVEHHRLGHHVLENAITLCWAGLALAGPSSARWVARGRALLRRELGDQVLADGTHDERSPMFQALLAEALLRLAEVAGPSHAGEGVRSVARAGGEVLLGSLRALSHPDGQIALFNDAVFREAPAAGVLQRRFSVAEEEDAPEDDAWALPAAGYYGVRRGELYVAFDAGPIGPDHHPGHGHADALSFELAHDGRRLFTDTGVFTYESGRTRSWDRGTAAHNTVQVDGLDQSELWGAFGCGRRIYRTRGAARRVEDRVHFGGGYVGAVGPRRLEHRRECAVRGDRLVFTDQIESAGDHEAVLRLHVGPGLEVGSSPDGPRVLDSHLPLALVQSPGLEWAVEESPYHPEFGVEIARRCLAARVRFRDRTSVSWQIRLL